jgi:hypothetical protein
MNLLTATGKVPASLKQLSRMQVGHWGFAVIFASATAANLLNCEVLSIGGAVHDSNKQSNVKTYR